MKYTFRPSTTLILISIVSTFAVLSLIVPLLDNSAHLYIKIPSLIGLALLLAVITQTPLYTTITTNKIVIKKLIGKLTIIPDGRIVPLTTKDIAGSIRKFGNSGLFFYGGKYWNQNLGNYNLLAINHKELALIKDKNSKRTYIINYPHAILNNSNDLNTQQDK